MTNKSTENAQTPSDVRIIKKYPNRRLYDTHTSSYITLEEVRDLIGKYQLVRVIDSKNKDDITRSILLQIILELESAGGSPIFSDHCLTWIIRAYSHSTQMLFGSFLDNSIQAFDQINTNISSPMQSAGLFSGSLPSIDNNMWSQLLTMQNSATQQMMAAYVSKSFDMAKQMQEQMTGQTMPVFTQDNNKNDDQ